MWKLSATSAREPTAYPVGRRLVVVKVRGPKTLTDDELDEEEKNVDDQEKDDTSRAVHDGRMR